MKTQNSNTLLINRLKNQRAYKTVFSDIGVKIFVHLQSTTHIILKIKKPNKPIIAAVVFLLGLIIIPNMGYSQSQQDQKEILQCCIDFSEIQNRYPEDANGDKLAVRIMQHTVSFSNDMEIQKFGENVIFYEKDEIYTLNTIAFLRFEKFDVEGINANVIFEFNHNRQDPSTSSMLYITLQLEKENNQWSINEYTILGR